MGLSGVGLAVKVALDKHRPTVEKHWDPDVSSLMQSCWDHDAKARPSFPQITLRLQKIISKLSDEGMQRSTSSFAANSSVEANLRGVNLWDMIKTEPALLKNEVLITKGAEADVGDLLLFYPLCVVIL